jgi:hypothetical protein
MLTNAKSADHVRRIAPLAALAILACSEPSAAPVTPGDLQFLAQVPPPPPPKVLIGEVRNLDGALVPGLKLQVFSSEAIWPTPSQSRGCVEGSPAVRIGKTATDGTGTYNALLPYGYYCVQLYAFLNRRLVAVSGRRPSWGGPDTLSGIVPQRGGWLATQ